MAIKRIFCAILCLVLCVPGAVLAQEEQNSSFSMAGFDSTQYRDWAKNEFFTRVEEKTGVHFEFTQYTDAVAWTKAKADMRPGNADLPEVLFKARLTGAECLAMRENGVLIDLKPYLSSCCPNLWAMLEKNPEAMEAITLPDGSIAALPYISEIPVQNYIWVNQEWMDNLRLAAPANAQEFKDMLSAFKTRDPNKNGKQDEIPLGFLGPFDLKFLAHAFGLIANDYNLFVQDGQVRFMPLEENYRSFVTWCRELYTEGLLDKNGFTMNDQLRTVNDSKAAPTYGAIITAMAADVFQTSWVENYVILMPLFYEGNAIYRDYSGPVLRGTFAVTSACKDPEKVLQWVDYLYSEEGAVLATIGLENTDYLVDGDGSWRYLDGVQKNFDTFRGVSLIQGGGADLPGVSISDFEHRMSGNPIVQKVLEQQKQFNEYVKQPFPYYTLTRGQAEQIAPLQAQLGYYVDMQLARWVLGEEEISDETFAAFETKLRELGLDKFISFWQNILNER